MNNLLFKNSLKIIATAAAVFIVLSHANGVASAASLNLLPENKIQTEIQTNELLEQKLEECTELLGHILLDLLIVSLKKIAKENQTIV